MHPMAIVILLEIRKLSLQIRRIPEQQVVQILATNGAEKWLHKRMRHRDIWSRLDCLDSRTTEFRLPAVRLEHRMVIRAELGGNAPSGK